ncbi:tRNA lysidine(34) synthetase TilS [Gordonia sinesedis]
MNAASAVDEITRSVTAFAGDVLDADVRCGTRPVCVGLSGGADSLALTAAAVRAGLRVRALVVDHGLQQDSATVAQQAAVVARDLGAAATVLSVSVGRGGGPEAAARAARYAALDAARDGAPVLLAHTLDDQAETVLMGLARGSGARSIAGMRAWSEPWGRPLLALRRRETVDACAELGLTPYVDPHNSDPRFTRVRVRTEVLPLLDDVLHGGVAEALARTGAALRSDTEALDEIADGIYGHARVGDDLVLGPLIETPMAVRTRVIRRWLLDVGATEPTGRVIGAVDALATGRGTGRVAVGGDPRSRVGVERRGDRLVGYCENR